MKENEKKDNRGGARPGAGRPKLKKQAQRISIRIPKNEYKLMMMYAEFYNKTQTEIILDAIGQYLTQQCLYVDPYKKNNKG